jgi:hypothetical protein
MFSSSLPLSHRSSSSQHHLPAVLVCRAGGEAKVGDEDIKTGDSSDVLRGAMVVFENVNNAGWRRRSGRFCPFSCFCWGRVCG